MSLYSHIRTEYGNGLYQTHKHTKLPNSGGTVRLRKISTPGN